MRRKRHHRLSAGPARRAGVLRHGSAAGHARQGGGEIGTAVAGRAASGWRIADKPWVRSGRHRPCRQGLERPGPAPVPWPDAGCLRILVRLGYTPPPWPGVAAAGSTRDAPGQHDGGRIWRLPADRILADPALPCVPRPGPAQPGRCCSPDPPSPGACLGEAAYRWQAAGPRPGLRLACLWRSVGGERGPVARARNGVESSPCQRLLFQAKEAAGGRLPDAAGGAPRSWPGRVVLSGRRQAAPGPGGAVRWGRWVVAGPAVPGVPADRGRERGRGDAHVR